jgi:hypothetical protein
LIGPRGVFDDIGEMLDVNSDNSQCISAGGVMREYVGRKYSYVISCSTCKRLRRRDADTRTYPTGVALNYSHSVTP